MANGVFIGMWFFLLSFLLAVSPLKAQVYSDQDVQLAKYFIVRFNHDDYSDLYENCLSDQLKAEWPSEKAFEFFLKLKKESGRITRLDITDTFTSGIRAKGRVWPISFEKGESEIQLITDAFSKVTDIVARPKPKSAKPSSAK